MGGHNELAAVQQLRPRKIIEEEVNSVDMHQIGVPNMPQHRWGDRVARRAKVRNPLDVNANKGFSRRQFLTSRIVE